MKKVYICGDSFATSDPEYGACWVDLLSEKLAAQAMVYNNSSVAASNLLVSIQVKQAIDDQADFVIVQGTAVTRDQVSVQPVSKRSLLERFALKHLIAFSIYRPYRSYLNSQQQQVIQDYYSRFFDLDLCIYRDECIIENSLQRLTDNNIPFLFDQGGFEHPSFGAERTDYFTKFRSSFSQVNLWDLGNTVDERPYYHIKELPTHRKIADYYYEQIKQYL
jgi:hypothetical protein